MEDQECSSGCESGWTLYLEQSFLSPYPIHSPRGNNAHFIDQRCGGDFVNTEDEDEEEDMSMVSDASSGPPHFQEDEHVYNNSNNAATLSHQEPVDAIATTLLSNKGVKKQNTKENRRRKLQDLPSFLDDTASSPFYNFSNNNLTLTNNQASMEDMVGFSQGYSTTHFQRKSTFQDHFGFYDYHHSSVPGSQLQQNQKENGDEMKHGEMRSITAAAAAVKEAIVEEWVIGRLVKAKKELDLVP